MTTGGIRCAKLDALLNQQRQSTEVRTQPDAVSNKLARRLNHA